MRRSAAGVRARAPASRSSSSRRDRTSCRNFPTITLRSRTLARASTYVKVISTMIRVYVPSVLSLALDVKKADKRCRSCFVVKRESPSRLWIPRIFFDFDFRRLRPSSLIRETINDRGLAPFEREIQWISREAVLSRSKPFEWSIINSFEIAPGQCAPTEVLRSADAIKFNGDYVMYELPLNYRFKHFIDVPLSSEFKVYVLGRVYFIDHGLLIIIVIDRRSRKTTIIEKLLKFLANNCVVAVS